MQEVVPILLRSVFNLQGFANILSCTEIFRKIIEKKDGPCCCFVWRLVSSKNILFHYHLLMKYKTMMNPSMEIDNNEDVNPPPFPLILSAFVLAVDEELEEQEA